MYSSPQRACLLVRARTQTGEVKAREQPTNGGQGHPFAEGCEEWRICQTDEIL
ncbi:hypothetical protein [Nitrosococcus oceani]|uniref:hypothetical protein n=1 Tax=Nitrosococcus oceani TaxID=1229 RepID=UPI000183C817|nr:hypothetical protein [Nitrosococcus oceani]EDZ66483.1 hypothetical protein NOC27_3163 [Nitrosococcus oceani AFC27]